MVRRQRERQYQSAREHRDHSQTRSGTIASSSRDGAVQRRLPFSHCALSLTPYETPVANKHGIIFENSIIMPFIMKHKIDPVTGESMTFSDVIALHMDKDEEGRWQCPVLTKPFTDHTKVVAILQRPSENRKTANVYSYEAYYELNVKPKSYQDLTTGETFDKQLDVLILNDPENDEFNKMRDINTFYHVLHARELERNKSSSTTDAQNNNIKYSVTATRIMEKLQGTNNNNKKELLKKRSHADLETNTTTTTTTTGSTGVVEKNGKRIKVLAKDVTGVSFSSGKASSSLTSTTSAIAYQDEAREATPEEILQSQMAVMRKRKKKGYVKLITNMGEITLELHCDIVPRTCINFLGLCQANQYDNTKFHRLIPNFMIQGGKTNKKGQNNNSHDNENSIWGGAFVDEFDDRLKHTGQGVISMANAGPNTNRRQFFITFKSCNHLDRKHSVFGSVIEGKDVLNKMERIATDNKDRPLQEITILSTVILADPAQEAADIEFNRLETLARARAEATLQVKKASQTTVTRSDNDNDKRCDKNTIGKYLKTKNPPEKLLLSSSTSPSPSSSASAFALDASTDATSAPARLPPAPAKTTFQDFSGW